MLGLNLNTNMPFSPLLEKTHAMTPEEEVDAVTGKNNTLISLINVYVNAVRAVIKHNLSILSLLTQWDQLHSISITTFGKLHKYFWLLKISHLSIEINLMEASQFTAVGSCGLHDLFKLLITNNICVCMKNMRSYFQ